MIQQIRRLFDFNRFLLASFEHELKTVAEHNLIVIINANDYRCDAIIIQIDQIRALSLSHLCITDIWTRINKSLAKSNTLEWLWKIITRLVFNTLGFTQTIFDDCWPHLWWIFMGPLIKFLIHATKCYSSRSFDVVIDRVISSYSSFVKTIIHDRRHCPQPTRRLGSKRVILLAMPKTPG